LSPRYLVLACVAMNCLALPAGARMLAFEPRINPKVKSGRIVIRKALVLPPRLEFAGCSMKGCSYRADEAERLSGALSDELVKELTARGVTVDAMPPGEPGDAAANSAGADLQTQYDNIRVQIRKKPLRVDRGQISMGDSIAGFTPARGYDVLVLVRGQAVKATRIKTIALIAGVGTLPGFQGDVAFIDRLTGDVLAWARIIRARDLSERPEERLGTCVRDAINGIPFPLPPAK
jgi:hypothetical protein